MNDAPLPTPDVDGLIRTGCRAADGIAIALDTGQPAGRKVAA